MNKLFTVIKCLLLTALIVSVSGHISGEEWPASGRDSSRKRETNEKLSASLSEAWSYQGAAEIVSSPSVSDGFIVFGSRDKSIRALKESDGSLIWSFAAGDEIYASPAIENGKVYVPSVEGKIYCLRLAGGNALWNYSTGGSDFSSPVIINNTMYVGSGYPNNKVLAINSDTKELVWEKALEQIVYSSPAYSDSKVIIGCDSGLYYALDKTDGTEIWSYPTGGDVLLSSPLVIGSAVYLLPGGASNNFYRVDIDQANWPSQNWQLALADPNEPSVGTILGTKLATSSPMKAGSFVAFAVRFDYSLDTNSDDMPDQYILNEYLVAVNPSTHLVAWQKPLGSRITSDQNKVPAFGLCPTPASMTDADSNYMLVVCSSLSTELKIINPSDGAELASYSLDGATRSSPAIANGRVYVATEKGSLYAFQCDYNHAPFTPASGFTPADNANVSQYPLISWDNALDSDESSANLIYEIRVDDDGEILENYDYVTTTLAGITSITLPVSYPDNTRLTYAVRAIDSNLAYSEWSLLQTFWVGRDLLAPIPPGDFRAMPGDTTVELLWNSSPSTDVNYYLVSWKQTSGSYGAPVLLAETANNYTVTGLTNGVSYAFRIIARDYDSLDSTPVEIISVPAYPVMLNSTPYDTFVNALNNAQSGDTIRLGVGTVVIPYTLEVKEGVNIIGYSPHHTIINATGLNRGLSVVSGNGAKGVFSNFTLYGAQIGIDTGFYKVSVKNTVIHHCNIGLLVGSGSEADIVNNTIIHNSAYGLQVASDDADIRNNIIMYNGYGIYVGTGKTPEISYNDLYGNTHDYQNCSAGTGDIAVLVLFEDEPNNYYLEAQNQPTIDMGDPADDWLNEPDPHGGRVNLGAYGNTIYAPTSGPFHIATTSLSDTESGAYYSAKISTGGGSPPVTWTITSGAIPPGLALVVNTGYISGTVQPGNSGTYNFSVYAIDTLSNTDTYDFAIIVSQASDNQLHIVTNVLSNGEVRTSYYALISAASGFTPYIWSIIDGSLPYGLSLNSATGEIAGTVPYGMEGRYLFTVKVTDEDKFSASKELNILINAGFATGSSGKGKGGKGCFIATAAYGSPLAPAVNILRIFRDNYLVTNKLGEWIILKYYKCSPPIANYIANHKWAKTITQIALLPIVAYGWYMTLTGLSVKMLTCILIILSGIVFIKMRRRLSLAKR